MEKSNATVSIANSVLGKVGMGSFYGSDYGYCIVNLWWISFVVMFALVPLAKLNL